MGEAGLSWDILLEKKKRVFSDIVTADFTSAGDWGAAGI
jgi:hypothetical protein